MKAIAIIFVVALLICGCDNNPTQPTVAFQIPPQFRGSWGVTGQSLYISKTDAVHQYGAARPTHFHSIQFVSASSLTMSSKDGHRFTLTPQNREWGVFVMRGVFVTNEETVLLRRWWP